MKIILIFLLLLISNFAQANCGHVMSIPTFDYTISDQNAVATETLTLTRNNRFDIISCPSYQIAFGSWDSSKSNRKARHSQGNDTVNYNLYKNINLQSVLKANGSSFSTNEALTGTIGGGETKELSYYFSLVGNYNNTTLRPGIYSDTINLQSYSLALGFIRTPETSGVLNVRINVPRYIALSLIDSGDVFDETKTSKVIDFGELDESATRSFDIRVVSNSGYKLQVSSANQGKLKRVNGSGNSSLINYNFYVKNSNQATNLGSSNPVEIAKLNNQITPPGGDLIPVRVVIGNVSNKDPGDYEDYITLSVVSTN